MAGQFSFADVIYTLEDIYVSEYDINDNSYSDVIGRIAAPQNVNIDPEHDTDTLAGAGRSRRRLSVQRGAVVALKLGGVDVKSRTVMTGGTNRTSNTAPNRRRQFDVPAGGRGLPYFGMICTGPTDDGGLWVAGLQCLKLDKVPGFTLDGETNSFSMSEVNAYAIPVEVNNVPYTMRELAYEDASLFTAPTDGDSFLAWFSDLT